MMRVLIVEDDVDALELIQAWSEEQGWDVRTARTGQAAVGIGKGFKPDLLITDYFLDDDVNGLSVIEQLREEDSNLRVVLITGSLADALKESARLLQRVPILTKPFDFQRLDQVIRDSHSLCSPQV